MNNYSCNIFKKHFTFENSDFVYHSVSKISFYIEESWQTVYSDRRLTAKCKYNISVIYRINSNLGTQSYM